MHEPAARAVPPAGTTPTRPGAAEIASHQQPNSYDQPGTDHLVEEEKKGPGNFMVVPQIEATFALGETAEFAGSFGIGGFGIDARYVGFRPWRLGGSVSWQTIAQRKEDESISSGNATYSGTMIKELSYNPLLAKVGYTLSDTKKLRTYASFGLGATRSMRRVDTGIVSLFDEEWHFTIAPEAGVEVPVGPVHLVVSGRLSYLTPAGSINDQFLFNLCVGVGFD